MIRINLLPFRAAREKENVKRQISVYVLVVFLLLAGVAYFWIQLSGQLADLKKEEKDVRAELKTYDKTIKRIQELEKKIKEITVKLSVMKGLEKNKTGPVHLLDEISNAVPKDKLWLKSLRESKGILNLSGTAMDNETVALFMTNLEKSSFIKTVDLKSVKLQYLSKYKLRVSNFDLQCRTYAFQAKKPKSTAKRKKR